MDSSKRSDHDLANPACLARSEKLYLVANFGPTLKQTDLNLLGVGGIRISHCSQTPGL